MLLVLCWCFALATDPLPTAEYTGPTYAEQGGPPASVAARVRGQVLLWAVRAGAGPDWVEWTFGPPPVVGQFRLGPVEWSYPELGVTAYFPPRLLRPAGPAMRVQGGIQ